VDKIEYFLNGADNVLYGVKIYYGSGDPVNGQRIATRGTVDVSGQVT
jgi:hypothetical protein